MSEKIFDRGYDREDVRGGYLTREDIYDLEAGEKMDQMIEDSFDERKEGDEPRPFSSNIGLCFEYIVAGFSWFRLSKSHEDDDFWCELRIFPKDYQKRGIYYKHLARSKDPTLAICKAYLIFVNKRGNSFGDYPVRNDDREFRRDLGRGEWGDRDDRRDDRDGRRDDRYEHRDDRSFSRR